jgi:hypothetical protein
VREYPDVFPEELLGLPPDIDTEFLIELMPGTRPIAKRPYKMDVDELNELSNSRSNFRKDLFDLVCHPGEHQYCL